MAKRKRKVTTAEKAKRKIRKAEYITVLVGGKQKRGRRPPLIDGVTVEEFVVANADPLWLHQNGMWEYLPLSDSIREDEREGGSADDRQDQADQESNGA